MLEVVLHVVDESLLALEHHGGGGLKLGRAGVGLRLRLLKLGLCECFMLDLVSRWWLDISWPFGHHDLHAFLLHDLHLLFLLVRHLRVRVPDR